MTEFNNLGYDSSTKQTPKLELETLTKITTHSISDDTQVVQALNCRFYKTLESFLLVCQRQKNI